MPSDECAHRHSLPALELQVGDVIPNGRPTRRLEKRQLAVDGLRGRYCELVSSAVLDQLLPNPGVSGSVECLQLDSCYSILCLEFESER